MKFVKEVDGKEVVIEETNENHFHILEREGFKPSEDEKPKKK